MPDDAPEQGDAQDSLAELAKQVANVAEQLAASHARAQARERVIDHLHAEVERLRVGEQALLLRPVITDLQSLRRDLLRQAETLPEQIDSAQVSSLLVSFALSAEQALERCGIVPVRPAVGDAYAARQHTAVKILDAETETQHETIAEVVSEGYLDTNTDRVTVPARVAVWRWKPVEETPSPIGQEETVD
ncbi:nucleotide exchange factor GrpE [Kibdelosporangium aridum]|uniref:Nucleotide exchange factor GrpE n=1 Tax=Kibdelosporangium aridum TaxID=2030 RepID=A0A428Z9T7_KIBAR|nr:nucleotide exchange factor GrpE [Kibdelosporangium aridum]RSM84760.1 nucleotide exchange factor GrpE [Kibdelosporangium aridum]